MSKTSNAQIYDTTIDLGIGTNDGFKLLADQKLELLKLLKKGAPEILEGLVNLIDHIQDTCAAEKGIPVHIVFPHWVHDKNIKSLKVGDDVMVDPPEKHDNWNNEFKGTVTKITSHQGGILFVVQDTDGNHFEMIPHKIKRL